MKGKIYLLILTLLLGSNLYAQETPANITGFVFEAFLKDAKAGNSKAMNGVGVYYLSGRGGIEINATEALKWFEKSASAGYPTAWFNIGMMFKDGNGVKQDFNKAFEAFCHSVEPSSFPIKHQSYYTLGYMTYKGLGCQQNYQQAITYFRKGIMKNSPESMYMLGLCFRNGYGIQVNIDSARYWLLKSSQKGYSYAKDELQNLQPETNKYNLASEIAKVPAVKAINIKEGYQKISHRLFEKDISGKYSGHLVKFDWSGKYIIEQVPLTVSLKIDNNIISGEWNENDTYSAHLKGKLTDSCILFESTEYELNDHYNKKNPNTLEFKKTALKFDINKDTVYLTGNLELYSKKLKEPEKPIFLILIKSPSKGSVPETIKITRKNLDSDILNYVVFPNPFTDVIQINYKLNKSTNIRYVITSVLTGKIVYNGLIEKIESGQVNKSINVVGPIGWYVLTQYYGNKHRSNLIYKN